MKIVTKNLSIIIILISYTLGGLLLLYFYQYQLNPDATSYISIAKKYAQGDYFNALNAYWGPMISWTTALFLIIGFPPLIAIKTINILSGSLTLIAVLKLSQRFNFNLKQQIAILATATPMTWYFALSITTPDLILSLIIITYLYFIFDPNYHQKTQNAIFCGILGALSYFTKLYSFFFFIIHFALMNIYHHSTQTQSRNKKRIFKNAATGFTFFFAISLIWINLLTIKYGELTIGNTGKFIYYGHNPNKVLPGALSQRGFVAPPNTTATSAWEDPTFLPVIPWHPFYSLNHLKHQLHLTKINLIRTLLAFQSFSPISIITLLLALPLIVNEIKHKKITHQPLFLSLITIVIYSSGLLLIWSEARYHWITALLLLLMSVYIAQKLFNSQQTLIKGKFKTFALIIILLSFTITPLRFLFSNINIGKDTFLLAQKLKKSYGIQNSIIASNHSWGKTAYLALYLESRSFNHPKDNATKSEIVKDIKQLGIDYYLVYDSDLEDISYLSEFTEITRGEIANLQIFKIKD